MIKVVLYDAEVNLTNRLDPVLTAKRYKVRELREAGYNIKTNPLNAYHRIIYWLEFETEEEAAIFKLTHL
jgi:hypothetical protein